MAQKAQKSQFERFIFQTFLLSRSPRRGNMQRHPCRVTFFATACIFWFSSFCMVLIVDNLMRCIMNCIAGMPQAMHDPLPAGKGSYCIHYNTYPWALSMCLRDNLMSVSDNSDRIWVPYFYHSTPRYGRQAEKSIRLYKIYTYIDISFAFYVFYSVHRVCIFSACGSYLVQTIDLCGGTYNDRHSDDL